MVLVCPGSRATSCFYPGNCPTWQPQALKPTRPCSGASGGPRVRTACSSRTRGRPHQVQPQRLSLETSKSTPLPQIIKGSGAQGEGDWKPRRKVSQCRGQEGRGSHVKQPQHKPPTGMREHSISSFQDPSLWQRARRRAVQGKHGGSPHMVHVSGRLDVEGLVPSVSQKLHVPE